MKATHDLATKFSSARFDKGRMKAFADHVAKIEASGDIQIIDILDNGIPPFEDLATVHFKVPRTKIGGIIGDLLGAGTLNPSVIINGIPAERLVNVHVAVRGH
ncbi:hypothetical protein [Sphingopyxis sp.]|jgi:hypothetical protein|uniref:hypothetical protein n=1 Tax=Sphingopyxis sp. TaxID=1908224 RepID=UPI002FCAF596